MKNATIEAAEARFIELIGGAADSHELRTFRVCGSDGSMCDFRFHKEICGVNPNAKAPTPLEACFWLIALHTYKPLTWTSGQSLHITTDARSCLTLRVPYHAAPPMPSPLGLHLLDLPGVPAESVKVEDINTLINAIARAVCPMFEHIRVREAQRAEGKIRVITAEMERINRLYGNDMNILKGLQVVCASATPLDDPYTPFGPSKEETP